MKAQKNNRRRNAGVENLRILRDLWSGLAIAGTLIGLLASSVTIGQAQVVRGEKIDFSPAPTNTNAPAPGNISTNLTATPTNTTPEFITSEGEKYRVISFAHLASFEFKITPGIADLHDDSTGIKPDTQEQLPKTIRALNEKSVALTGFMMPVESVDGTTTDFLLLRNQSACCYGVMPRINEWVEVKTAGKAVKIKLDVPVMVLGTLHVGDFRENGLLTGIYQLDCDQIKIPEK